MGTSQANNSKSIASYTGRLGILIIGVAGTLSSCMGSSHNWVEVAKSTEGDHLFVDNKSIEKRGFFEWLLSRKELPEVVYLARLEYAEPEENTVAKETLYGADCSGEKLAFLKITEYDSNGKAIYSSDEDEYSYRELIDAPPKGSIGYAAFEFACDK